MIVKTGKCCEGNVRICKQRWNWSFAWRHSNSPVCAHWWIIVISRRVRCVYEYNLPKNALMNHLQVKSTQLYWKLKLLFSNETAVCSSPDANSAFWKIVKWSESDSDFYCLESAVSSIKQNSSQPSYWFQSNVNGFQQLSSDLNGAQMWGVIAE